MSDGEIQYNVPGVIQQAQDLGREATAIAGLLEQERQMLTTLSGAWTGTAKEAWLAQQQRWQQKADELNSVLSQMVQAINDATAIMQEMDRKNAEQF